MGKRKSKKQLRKKYSWIAFWIFSAVLFINNTTQLFQNWIDLTYAQINTITWLGVIGSLGYVLWLKD